MPRITPATHTDAKSQAMLDQLKQTMGGRLLNLFPVMAHSPAVLGFYVAGSGVFKDAKLPAAVREQVALTVAGVNHCDYCASAHTAIGKWQKIPEAEMAQNLKGTASDAKVQAALTFVKKLLASHGNIADADLAALRSAGYTDGEALELVALTAFNIFTNYFNHVAGTEVDFPLVSAK